MTSNNNVENLTAMYSDAVVASVNNLADGPEITPYLAKLLAGRRVCGDTYVPFSKPDWFDAESFHRGQQFAVKYKAALFFSELTTLITGLLFSFSGTFEPLIFTGKSDTPYKAFKRYLSTVLHVTSWLEGDIWDPNNPGHHSLKTTRRVHEAVRQNMNNCSEEELAKRTTLEDPENYLWTDCREKLLGEFKLRCPVLEPLTNNDVKTRPIFLNQCDMAMTQVAFCGGILTYPEMFGIYNSSRADLEGFAHFWRTIAYLIGVKDEYNLCDGDLATVQQRLLDIKNTWLFPVMRTVSCEGIHMARCALEGLTYVAPMPLFESLTLYLCNIFGIHAPRLRASLSIWQFIVYMLIVFHFKVVLRLPGIHELYSWLISLYVKKAQNFSKKKLMELKNKKYPFYIYKNQFHSFL